MYKLCVVCLPSFPGLLSVLEELVRQKLLDGPSLLRVLDEALFNEVSKAVTPLGWDALNRFVDYSVKQSLQVLSTIMERWITFSRSNAKHPNAHTSTSVEYVLPWAISGEIQLGVPF